jgi:UDP-N-acetylglucosamine:LPS N-acetylglucosamine transferase
MAEAVVKKLPMILTDIRPGHELINLNYLVKNGIAAYARIPREAVFMAEQVLDGKLSFNHERNYEKIVKQPQAVSIVDAVKDVIPLATPLKVSHYQADLT